MTECFAIPSPNLLVARAQPSHLSEPNGGMPPPGKLLLECLLTEALQKTLVSLPGRNDPREAGTSRCFHITSFPKSKKISELRKGGPLKGMFSPQEQTFPKIIFYSLFFPQIYLQDSLFLGRAALLLRAPFHVVLFFKEIFKELF